MNEEAKELQDELSAQRSKMKDEYLEHLSRLNSDRDKFEEQLEEKRKKRESEQEQRYKVAEEELEKKEKELEEQEKSIRDRERVLKSLEKRLEEEREDLEDAMHLRNEKVERAAARRIEEFTSRFNVMRECLEKSREERNALEKQLQERKEADLRFGSRKPEEIFSELRDLVKERDELRRELNHRPSADAVLRLEELEREKELWESERWSLISEISELKQQAERNKIAVCELESHRNYIDALKASKTLLEQGLKELKERIDSSDKEDEGAFPSCKVIDQDLALSEYLETSSESLVLRDLSRYIRHSMAYGPKAKLPLYYSEEDVRSFIGGLAMSRLLLLQGISGTGKTSLPKAFADAFGAEHELIAVQAGWRDRQDLIGYYNSFEKKFYEQKFLRDLYKAGVPRYKDTPFFIVLDEMNLSHPEQYFADLISALESGDSLEICTAPLTSAPKRFMENGKFLSIPENVWFVGTANHDETTKDFADKTYDRAYVLELPRNRKSFERNEDILSGNSRSYSLKALTDAFSQAKKKYRQEAKRGVDFLENHLGDILHKGFRLGWGNRLEKQMDAYIPVVIDCGGSLGEAMDYILAGKILRKIRDRHDNLPENIQALKEKIENTWAFLDASSKPRKSLYLLENELHRLGGDPLS